MSTQQLSPPVGESRFAAAGLALTGGTERERLLQQLQPLIRRLVRRYGADRDHQQDLNAEIYHRFLRLYEDYDPRRGIPLTPYLIRNLEVSVYTYVRSQWRADRLRADLDLEEQESLPGRRGLTDPTEEWLHRLYRADLLERIGEALSELTPRQREAILGRYYESRTDAEIAERMNVKEATVRSLSRFGIQRLRLILVSPDSA